MKILAYSLFILGFVIIALSRPSSDHANLPLAVIGVAVGIVGAILLCRSNMGIKVTGKYKVRIEETPHISWIRGLLANFTAVFGFLSFVSGITYPLYADSHPDIGWRGAVLCLGLGAFLLFCSRLLMRRSRL
jgi:hypothetical protein